MIKIILKKYQKKIMIEQKFLKQVIQLKEHIDKITLPLTIYMDRSRINKIGILFNKVTLNELLTHIVSILKKDVNLNKQDLTLIDDLIKNHIQSFKLKDKVSKIDQLYTLNVTFKDVQFHINFIIKKLKLK